MPKVLVLYYSRTGNTEKMAGAVAQGAREIEDVDVELTYYESPENLVNFDAIAIGMPTYHHDMSVDLKNFLEEVAVRNIDLKNKVGVAFGSYGWSGEAPRLVLEVMKHKFGMRTLEPPLLIRYTPDQDGLGKCRELGKRIGESLVTEI